MPSLCVAVEWGVFGMARLIDADLMAAEETGAFISAQAQITDTATRLVNEVVHKKIQMLLADAPTVEIARPTRSQFKRMAVQLGYEKVVHCKDCAYWGNEETKVATEYQLFCVCDVLKRRRKAGNCMTNEDFFCADGDRRADANEPAGT